MKYLKYVVLVASIASSAFFLYARLWANDKSLGYEGPTFIQISADHNELSIRFQNKLINIWRDGQIKDVLDIGDFGKRLHSNFGYFPNGDLLFYHYDDKPSFLDNVAKYLRHRDRSQKPSEGEEGFYRCNTDTYLCERWAPEMPAIGDRAFGLEIDPETSDVYISATGKFELYKYSVEGRLVAKTDSGLRFPNVIKLHNGLLYIADTNHHRIKVVSPKTHNFGEQVEAHTAKIEGTQWIWPVAMEPVAGDWWVSIKGDNMSWGRILKFNSDWSKSEKVELPDWSWPVGMAYFSNTVWMADMERFEIYRFSPDGSQLESLSGPQWQALLEESKSAKAYYDNVSLFSLVLMVICLVAGLAGVYKLDKENSQKAFDDRFKPEVDSPSENYVPPEFKGNQPNWYKPRKYKQIKMTLWLLRLTPVMLFASFIPLYMSVDKALPLELFLLIAGMSIFIILLERMLNDILQTELGVHPKGILIKKKGRVLAQRRFDDIYHSVGYLFVGKQSLSLGNQAQGGIFDANIVEGYIRPKLSAEKKLSPLRSFYYLLSLGDFMTYALVIMSVLSLTTLPLIYKA